MCLKIIQFAALRTVSQTSHAFAIKSTRAVIGSCCCSQVAQLLVCSPFGKHHLEVFECEADTHYLLLRAK